MAGEDPAAARTWAWPTIAAGVLIFLSAGIDPASIDAQGLALAGAKTALGLLVVSLGAAGLMRRPAWQTLQVGPSQPRMSVLELVLIGLGMLALSGLLDAALEGLGLRDASRLAAIEAAVSAAEPRELPAVLLGLALAPALAEEVFFRGFLLGVLLLRTPAWIAVALSALIFGLAHMDLAQGGAALILGLYLGTVRVATGSIRAGIFAHFLNNSVAVLAPSVLRPLADHPLASTAMTLCLAVGLVGALWLLGRRLQA